MAERAFAAGSVAGVRVVADEDAGDVGEPEYLAAFGRTGKGLPTR